PTEEEWRPHPSVPSLSVAIPSRNHLKNMPNKPVMLDGGNVFFTRDRTERMSVRVMVRQNLISHLVPCPVDANRADMATRPVWIAPRPKAQRIALHLRRQDFSAFR